MAATTISRATWTDDDGTGTTGTIISNARLQADVYDKIDALFTANMVWEINSASAQLTVTKTNSTTYTNATDPILELSAAVGASDSCVIKHKSSGTHNTWGIKKGTSNHVLTVNVTGVPIDALTIPISGHLIIPELSADPSTSNLPSGAACAIYMKNDKIVFARNNAGSLQFLRCNLDASTITWVNSTVAP